MSRVWESVAPIVPQRALPNRVSAVGPGVTLEAVPSWFERERAYAEKDLGKRDTASAQACLKARFEAGGLGEICSGPGGTKRKNYEASWERIRIANLALWLARPSALHVDLVVTAEPDPSAGGSAIFTTLLESVKPLDNYAEASLTAKHLALAHNLATAIQLLQHPSTVWTAVRFLWLALTEDVWEIRYVNLWVAIEALFGPRKGEPIGAKLRTRVPRFLNDDDQQAVIARDIVKNAYKWRSAAVHGSRLAGLGTAEASDLTLKTEGIALTTLRKILSNPSLIDEFCAPSRDHYLDALAKGFPP